MEDEIPEEEKPMEESSAKPSPEEEYHCGQVFYQKIPLFDFLLKYPRCNSRRIRTAPYSYST